MQGSRAPPLGRLSRESKPVTARGGTTPGYASSRVLLTCCVTGRYFFSSRGPSWLSRVSCATLTPRCCRATPLPRSLGATRSPSTSTVSLASIKGTDSRTICGPTPLGGPPPHPGLSAYGTRLFPHAEYSVVPTPGARPGPDLPGEISSALGSRIPEPALPSRSPPPLERIQLRLHLVPGHRHTPFPWPHPQELATPPSPCHAPLFFLAPPRPPSSSPAGSQFPDAF